MEVFSLAMDTDLSDLLDADVLGSPSSFAGHEVESLLDSDLSGGSLRCGLATQEALFPSRDSLVLLYPWRICATWDRFFLLSSGSPTSLLPSSFNRLVALIRLYKCEVW